MSPENSLPFTLSVHVESLLITVLTTYPLLLGANRKRNGCASAECNCFCSVLVKLYVSLNDRQPMTGTFDQKLFHQHIYSENMIT